MIRRKRNYWKMKFIQCLENKIAKEDEEKFEEKIKKQLSESELLQHQVKYALIAFSYVIKKYLSSNRSIVHETFSGTGLESLLKNDSKSK